MKKILFPAAAVIGVMLGASSALALDPTPYMSGSGDSRMVMDGKSTTGARILSGENGMAPSDCPAGSYYDGPDETIVACGEGGMTYGMMAPPAGSMMSDGNPYPEGAMMLEQRENKM